MMTLKEALEWEHPCWGDNTCSIAKAMEVGAYLWAAELLIGAGEYSETRAAYELLRATCATPEDFKAAVEGDRLALLEQPHMTCASCGSIVWSDRPTQCGNCGESVDAEDNAE